MPLSFTQDTLILDASCIINLYASQQMEAILRSISASFTVAAYVYENEAFWIYAEGGHVESRTKEPIELSPFINSGLLRVVTIKSEQEAETLATLSAKIRDHGEAVTGAIAINRNWGVVIDDKKARRVIQETAAHTPLLYTLELVHYWAVHSAAQTDVIAATLQNIRYRATYMPHKGHPFYQWWHTILSSPE